MNVAKQYRERMKSKLLDAAKAIPKLETLDTEVKEDLLVLLKNFATVDEDSILLARTHSSVVLDVEFAHAQVSNLCDEEERMLDKAWARACARARETLVEDGYPKPTVDQVKNRASLDPIHDQQRSKLNELRSMRTLLEGLRKSLYARSVMVKILCDLDAELEPTYGG